MAGPSGGNPVLAQFFRNLTKTVGASGVQFVIMLCTTPIMTRLYEPEAYATFSIVNTTAAVMIGLGLLSLPNAYCAEKDPETRTEILQTMVLLLSGLVLLAFLVAGGMAVFGVHRNGMAIDKRALILLPLLVLTYGARQIIVYVNVLRGNFTRLSLGQVIEPVCSRGGSLAFGALAGGNPVFILLSVILGHISTMLLLFKGQPMKLHGHWRRVLAHLPNLIGNLRRYGDFVLFGTMSQQTQQVVMLGMQVAIATYFSKDLAGQYVLAVSILTMPGSLIALATAPVVYHHFIETEKNDPKNLLRYFLMASGIYLLAGLAMYAVLFFYGEELFKIVFGAQWAHAGRIASILSLAYVGTFLLIGVQSILTVTRRLRLQFSLEITTGLLTLMIPVLCFRTMEFDRAIFYLSLVWALRAVVLFAAALFAAFRHEPDIDVAQ